MPNRNKKLDPKSKPYETPPEPPARLKGQKHAIEYWQFISSHLVGVKLLTPLHLAPLETLCRTWQEYQSCCEWLDNNPDDHYQEFKNYTKAHPNIERRDQSVQVLMKLWPKFGLTPEGLGKLSKTNPSAQAAPAAAADPFPQFSKRKTG